MGCVIGHRGAAAYAPENTLAAFNKAYTLGCRFIEFDVQLSKDKELIVFHDDTLNRTTNGQGPVNLSSAEYLHSLDAGAWYSAAFQGEKIPTFAEALKWLIHFDMCANVEIKYTDDCAEAIVLSLLNHLQTWPKDKPSPLISSFNHEALALCREQDTRIPLGLLAQHWQSSFLTLAQDLKCVSIHISSKAAKKSLISMLKDKGFLVYVYTVNQKQHALRLFDWGVDAVFSDYPDLLL